MALWSPYRIPPFNLKERESNERAEETAIEAARFWELDVLGKHLSRVLTITCRSNILSPMRLRTALRLFRHEGRQRVRK